MDTWGVMPPAETEETKAKATPQEDTWGVLPEKVSPQDYAERSQKAGLAVGRSLEEHKQYLQQSGQFTSQGINALADQYGVARAKQKAATEGVPYDLLKRTVNNVVPFSDLLGLRGDSGYYQAKQRLAAGQATKADYETIGNYEHGREADQMMGAHTGTAIVQALGSIPKLIGEAWLGGKAVNALGGIVGGRLGSVMTGQMAKNPAISLANPAFRQAIGTHAGRMAILLPTMPSMYLEEARQRNLDEGRAPGDIRGFPAAMLHGYSNLLVLGTLQARFGPKGLIPNLATKGAVGVGEQAVADVAGGLWDEVAPDILKMKTSYGTIGAMARGDFGDAAHNAAVQFMTFAAFAGLHEHGTPEEAKAKMLDESKFYADEFDKAKEAAKKAGLSDKVADDRAADVVKDKAETAAKEAIDKDPVTERAPEAPTTEGEHTSTEPSRSPPRSDTVPSATTPEAAAIAADKLAEIDRIAKNVARDEYQSMVRDGAPKNAETRAKAQAKADEWRAGAIERAKTPAATTPADAQTDVRTPTIAQAEPEAGVGNPPAEGEIVDPGANTASENPTAAGQGAESAPQAGLAQPNTPPQLQRAKTQAEVAQDHDLMSHVEEYAAAEPRLMHGDLDQSAQAVAQLASQDLGRPVSMEEAVHALNQIAHEQKNWASIPTEHKAERAIMRARGLTDEQRQEYRAATKSVLDKLSPTLKQIVQEELKGFRFYKDSREAGRAAVDAYLSLPRRTPLSEKERAFYEDAKEKGKYGACYLGGDQHIYIDGGIEAGPKQAGRYGDRITTKFDTVEIMAHELGHVIDGRMHEISNDPLFRKVWKEELTPRIITRDANGKIVHRESPLTDYAREKATEGFAEFSRLLFGTDIPTAQIKADFRKTSALFKQMGFWPPERTGTPGKIKELFSERLAYDQSKPEHVDVLKKTEAPTESAVPDRAPEKAPEKVPPVGEWRDLAKAAGLTDQDITVIDILGRNLGDRKAATEKVAKQLGLTPKAASAAVTKAVNRLAATSKRQKADEFAMTDAAKETLRTLLPDAKQYKLMENLISGGSLRDTADKMGVSQEYIRKQQDKILVEMGLPAGEKGIEKLRKQMAGTEKKDNKRVLKSEARSRQKEMMRPEEEAMANEESQIGQTGGESDAAAYERQRAEQDMADMENPRFMRRPDEPMSETERGLVAGIHEDPLDETRRLILADAIEEGGSPNAEARAQSIRDAIANPPSERGVSDWRQLSQRQVDEITLLDNDKLKRFRQIHDQVRSERGIIGHNHRDARLAVGEALDRLQAEMESSGERLQHELPRPDAPQSLEPVRVQRFGPRLYQTASPGELLSIIDPMGDGMSVPDVPVRTKSSKPGRYQAQIEYYTEAMEDQRGEAHPPEVGRYENGDVGVDLQNDFRTPKRLRDSALSIEFHKGAHNNSGYVENAILRLKEVGWKEVWLDNHTLRLDSPLRQQLREQQARGLRTGEPMFMSIGGVVSKAKEVLDRAPDTKAFLKQLFTGPGKLPRSAFEESLSKDQKIAGHLINVEHTANDLTKAVGGDWRRVPKPVIEEMNAALQIPPEIGGVANPAYTAAMGRFTHEIATALRRMRGDIDALSTALIHSGALTENLKAVFEENLGTYLTRQYRAFIDPDWYDTLKSTAEGQAIINRAKAWFDAEARKAGHILSDEQLDGEIAAILKNDTKHDNPISFLTHSKLGSKDLGILKARKEMPEPLRALLGEIKDPIANYAASVGRMANLLENHVFQTRVKAVGLKEGFFSREPRVGLDEQVAPDDSKTMSGLRGLYTTKEIREAFEQHYHKEQLPQYMSAYMKALGVAKYAKTVLSPTAHLRQVIGNVFFNIANGHTVSADANKMLKEMWKSTDLGRAYERRLTELGVIDQSIHGNELKSIVDDASKTHDPFTMSTYVTENAIARWLKKGLNLAQKSYRWEDNLVKVHAFENEKAIFAKAYPDKPNSWHEEQAAAKVQATFPTWSRLPGGIKWLRRFPLIGPFVSFTSEVVRTTYNTAKIAGQEMRSDNEVIRKQGAKRMVGLMVSLSAFAAVSAMSRMLSDVTLDEEDAMRRFLPEWNRDSQLLHLGKDSSGKRMMIDLGRTDPHSYLWEPFQAGISGARSGTGTVWDTMEPALKPFIGEEIGTRTLFDIARNKQEQGGGKGEGMIYNPESSTLAKGGAIGAHILKGIEPGLIDEVLRTGGAALGVPPNPGGKQRDVGEEFLADFTGQRLIGLDAKESLKFAAKKYEERVKNADREVNQLVARNAQQGVRLKPEDVQDEFARGESMRRQVFDDLLSDVQAAKMLGMSTGEIATELKKSGVSKEAIGAVLGGRYQPRNLGQVLNRK